VNNRMIRDIVNLQRDVANINDEIPDGTLTLRRTAVLAITTAGTLITWQSRVRGQGITWSGTTITIPAPGYYLINCSAFMATAGLLRMNLFVNGVNVHPFSSFSNALGGITNIHVGTVMRYFNRSDSIQIQLLPSVNSNINVIAEGVAGESPFVHIVQLTNEAEV